MRKRRFRLVWSNAGSLIKWCCCWCFTGPWARLFPPLGLPNASPHNVFCDQRASISGSMGLFGLPCLPISFNFPAISRWYQQLLFYLLHTVINWLIILFSLIWLFYKWKGYNLMFCSYVQYFDQLHHSKYVFPFVSYWSPPFLSILVQ